ncbi:hypothetical protein BGY98DRAFT_994053, partial [Russula aff. rugulosa BPL654]
RRTAPSERYRHGTTRTEKVSAWREDEEAYLASGCSAGAGVLSMSQRVMMEAERESAIKRYREMKERKTREADRTLLTV